MREPAPDAEFLQKLGVVVFLVAELEGVLIYDLLRFQPVLPPELDFQSIKGMSVTGMTTRKLGEYLAAHAPKSTDPAVAAYYGAGGNALIEIGPQRNAMLHARPGVDGNDPRSRIRLVRWRIRPGPEDSETHMIDDPWLDGFIDRIENIREELVSLRPTPPGTR